jgi:hypothetical protein
LSKRRPARADEAWAGRIMAGSGQAERLPSLIAATNDAQPTGRKTSVGPCAFLESRIGTPEG